MPRKLPAIIAALMVAALAPAPAQAYTAIYAFGDSLSDVGNVFGATGGAIPGAPYANGQFSNGPVWVQDLAQLAGLSLLTPSGPPGHSTGGTDYAWGDATTGYSGTLNSPNVPPTANLQVAQFLSDHGAAPKGGLYTFTLGANDVNNILNGLNTGPSPAVDLAGAAFAEATEITQLAQAGARNFIVALVPDLGLTPQARALGPAAQLAASQAAFAYNSLLEQDLSTLTASLHGSLHFLDTFSWLDKAVADPTSVGLPLGANVTDPCYTGPYTGGGTACSNQNSYIFWDQLHPAAAVDALLAEQAWALAPSPSPGAGFASLGLLLLIGLTRKWV